MYCSNCGTKLPEPANFCSRCGTACCADPEQKVVIWDECEIQFERTGEKGLLFPKDIGIFRALRPLAAKGSCVAQSKEIALDCLHFAGPDKKIKRHQQAFNELEEELFKDGWARGGQPGKLWYNKCYRRVLQGERTDEK